MDPTKASISLSVVVGLIQNLWTQVDVLQAQNATLQAQATLLTTPPPWEPKIPLPLPWFYEPMPAPLLAAPIVLIH